MRSIALVLACTASLAACGGGGGGGGGSPSPPPAPGPVVGAPVMGAQSFSGTEDTVLTGQLVASDPGDTLTFAVATNPTRGTVAVTSAGAFTYTPNANFSGADTFTASVTDSGNHSVNATITLNMAAVNDAPTASNDVLAVTNADALNVLANDTDPDNDALTVTITGTPFVGTATVNADRTVKLALPAGFKGFSKFSYRVTDAANVTADATALVFVGIQPFKVVTLSPPPAAGGPGGIYVNDLFTSRLVHEPGITFADIVPESMRVDRGGRALTFQRNTPNGVELRYVDLDNLGQSRLVQGPIAASQSIGTTAITRGGRFVVFEFKQGVTPGQQQLNVFDRNGTGTSQRLSLPETDQALARYGTLGPGGTIYFPSMDRPTPPWTCAVYRADLATRTIARVSRESGDTPAYFWPLPDGSGYIDIRFYGGGGMGAWLTRDATPDTPTRLWEHTNLYYPGALSPDGRYFAFTEVNVNFGGERMVVYDTSSPGGAQGVGGAGFGSPVVSGYNGMRSDSQAMVVDRQDYSGGISGIFEVPLATPGTPTAVFLGSSSSIRPIFASYSDDGAQIIYRMSDYNTGDYWLAVTRRGEFGQSTRLTPAGQLSYDYDPGASGYVPLVIMVGSPDSAALVNVDVPQTMLTIGPTTGSLNGMALVAR